MFRMLGAAVAAVALSCAGAANSAVLSLPEVSDYGITVYRLAGFSNVSAVTAEWAYDSAFNTPDGQGGFYTNWWGGSFGVDTACFEVGCLDHKSDTIFSIGLGLTREAGQGDWLIYVDNRTRLPASRCDEGLSAPYPCGYVTDRPFKLTVYGDATSQTPTFTSATTAVPEPGAWALLTLGFGAVGGALRRFRERARRPALG